MRKKGRLDRSILLQFGVAMPEDIKEENEEHLRTNEGEQA